MTTAARTVWSGTKYLWYVPRAMFWAAAQSWTTRAFGLLMLFSGESQAVRWLRW